MSTHGPKSFEKVIVSGHSLGGSVADVFTLVDAWRFDLFFDLTVVSIASSGVDAYLPDPGIPGIGDSLDLQSDLVLKDSDGDLTGLVTPDFYVGIAHSEDRVHFFEMGLPRIRT